MHSGAYTMTRIAAFIRWLLWRIDRNNVHQRGCTHQEGGIHYRRKAKR